MQQRLAPVIRFYLGSFQPPGRRALHPHPPCGLSRISFWFKQFCLGLSLDR